MTFQITNNLGYDVDIRDLQGQTLWQFQFPGEVYDWRPDPGVILGGIDWYWAEYGLDVTHGSMRWVPDQGWILDRGALPGLQHDMMMRVIVPGLGQWEQRHQEPVITVPAQGHAQPDSWFQQYSMQLLFAGAPWSWDPV